MRILTKACALILALGLTGCPSLRTGEGRINWPAAVAEGELIQADFAAALILVQDDPELTSDLTRIANNMRQVLVSMREIRDTGNSSTLDDALHTLELLVSDQLLKADKPSTALALFVVSRSIARLRIRMTAVE